jgi:hypothetical protein
MNITYGSHIEEMRSVCSIFTYEVPHKDIDAETTTRLGKCQRDRKSPF